MQVNDPFESFLILFSYIYVYSEKILTKPIFKPIYMIENLVKLWQSNKSQDSSDGLKDIVNGYEDFEKVCSMWNTYIYMHDYRSKKYVYISPSLCNYLGIDYQVALSDGFDSISSQIHPEDLLILENKLFKRMTQFLSSIPEIDKQDPNFRFSYNFRISKNDGSYTSMSVVSKILSFNSKGKVELDFGMVTPINHLLLSDAIVLTISKSINDLDYVTLLQEEFNHDRSGVLHLTDRELEIIQLIKKGMGSNEMAEYLCLSQHTIRNHRKNILKKTNTNKVTELISLITKLGL